MGQDQPLELSEEEKKDLSFRLLREWWIAATKSLVETVGSEEALRHLKPYFVNAGRAGAYHIKRLTGLPTDDAGDIMAIWIGIAHYQISNAKVAVKASSKDYAIAEMTDCAVNGVCPEACFCWCLFVNEGGADLNPAFKTELIKCIPWGDGNCGYAASRKGMGPIDNPTMNIAIPEISPELAYFLSHAYAGENWVNATRAFIDASGTEKASQRLYAEMRKMGTALGKKLASRSNSIGNDPVSLIHWLCALHQRKETCSYDGNITNCEVMECPFSEAPPEICFQYEAFFNGICEAIDPSYEFAYDRMMTKGDKTCHWTIRKKGEATKEKAKEEAIPDDLVKRLAQKLIDGEISEEEFERKMTLLKKHSVVK